MIVLDASALIGALVSVDPGDVPARLASGACAPAHLDAEVGQVLRRLVTSGAMTAARATQAIEDVAQLGVERVALPALMPLAWRHRGSLTFYDALYVSLAMTTGYPLLTADARLARSARRLCRVQLVA